ncbi:uncharacterized protein LOC122811616 isoform X1 [Protopterus annectens]|uniref:uncharacterized protein LOC122811616 isoform X1 n=1 Tax=Protopterus annectens TaxID=7888 RepID=UPI001CFB69D2|nr:uncharacterized protein LOC122811616 isoform X1 [Protopterus annectens]
MNTLGKQSKTDVWNGNMALWWSVVATFLLKMSAGQQVDHILRQSTSCQKDTPSGDFGFYFDGDEIFYVDLDIKEVEYKLPEFQKFFFFEAQLGLQALSACHFNLDIYIKRSKGISGPKVPPKVKLYPSRPVELGKSSTLICHADGFFPSVLNISWSKNGTPLEEGITITDFYPGKEFTFERFSYLTSIPDGGDIYSCTVEHPALDQPNAVFWQAEKTFVHENGTVSLSIHKKLKGIYLYQTIVDCFYMNNGETVILIKTIIYNKERQLFFDSRVGKFIGITENGKIDAEYFNNNTEYLDQLKAEVTTFCRHNYDIMKDVIVGRKVIPRITVHPQRNVVEKHPNLLMCVTSGFYPQRIRVTMLKNGEEVTHDISSSGVVSNGNWTYQITLLIEFIPKKEDVYGCKVEHSSLKEPVIVEWRMEAYN